MNPTFTSLFLKLLQSIKIIFYQVSSLECHRDFKGQKLNSNTTYVKGLVYLHYDSDEFKYCTNNDATLEVSEEGCIFE